MNNISICEFENFQNYRDDGIRDKFIEMKGLLQDLSVGRKKGLLCVTEYII